ncbi:uridine kinase [Marinigracilibium pacificum]|uniref:Uridine kinase n=1 Tax=Marinigracilibium pacificum TaxID=2729599 RepID=A0A848IYX8_9BACT|nr:uridine kinase [Marinigracilibium pacificum]NMM47424.1 uridine kinase [Marinigracilibium pacificum]
MRKPFIIGITGGSGSGKTRFLNSLLENFTEEQVCLISQDNYYRPRNEQPVDESGVTNFDLPESIDHHMFAEDIGKLLKGELVEKEEYTFNNDAVTPEILKFKPAPVIVVEGIFVFHFTEVASKMDLKLFIDTKEHLMLKRRIIRDNEERGYDLDDVLYRFENHVGPTYEKYIAPYKSDADLIIPNITHFDSALEVITSFIKNKING